MYMESVSSTLIPGVMLGLEFVGDEDFPEVTYLVLDLFIFRLLFTFVKGS